MGVKTAIVWERNLRNKLLSSKSHQTLISIFLSPAIDDIQLWALFKSWKKKKKSRKKNLELWKTNWRIGFDLSEMKMAETVEISIA